VTTVDVAVFRPAVLMVSGDSQIAAGLACFNGQTKVIAKHRFARTVAFSVSKRLPLRTQLPDEASIATATK